MTARRRGRPTHPDVLTPAEWKTVDAVRHGMTNSAIARRRGISRDAVKFHVENARAKLGLDTRAELRHWDGVPADSAAARTRSEQTMTTAVNLGALGQIARAVKDLAAVEAFYRDVLGMTHLYTFGKLAFFDCGGVRLMLEDRSIIDVADLHNDSILYFRVADIHATQDALTSRGVEFTGAPHMIHKHADGTEEWLTFFKEPGGGLLALISQVRHGN